MSLILFLFIGGPADGDMREVEEYLDTTEVHYVPPCTPDAQPTDKAPGIQIARYHRRRFAEGQIINHMFVHESVPAVMPLLLQHYKPRL